MFDFLGVATDVSYKQDWEKHAVKRGARYLPDYPPVNEHYFDWIALLECVRAAAGTFRMIELGAGWAPWLVRAAFAARHVSSISDLEFAGVEADETHYRWIKDHFLDNDLNPDDFELLHGAVSPTSGMARFPKIDHPDKDYGASLRAVTRKSDYVEVQAYTLASLFDVVSGAIDFVHMDIQGTEYDVIPGAMELLKTRVKAMMVGTHISQEKHLELHRLFLRSGWNPIIAYPRHCLVETEFGPVKFDDGFLFYRNSQL